MLRECSGSARATEGERTHIEVVLRNASHTVYSHETRLLLCAHCAAPLEVPPEGGVVACSYCRHKSQIATRNEAADIEAARAKRPLNEAERFQRLLAQDGQPLMPPPSLQHYLVGGGLPTQLVPQALQDFAAAVAEVRGGAAYPIQERLYFLTLLLNGGLGRTDEEHKRRAVLETALETLTTARHKQVLRCTLARQAVKVSDFAAATDWLAPCDPYSDDIHMDTAYRFSQAYLATAKQEWDAVLHYLGPRTGDVPIADGSDDVCTLLRANAYEKQGQVSVAVQMLTPMAQSNLQFIEKVQSGNATLDLCPQSVAQLREQRRRRVASAGLGINWMRLAPFLILPVVFAVLSLTSADGATTDDGYPLGSFWLFMGASFLIGPGILVFLAIRKKRRREHFERVGVDGTAQILAVSQTGLQVNNQPQVAIQLQVFAGEMAPYQATVKKVVSMFELSRFQVGASLSIKVDPSKPSDILI